MKVIAVEDEPILASALDIFLQGLGYEAINIASNSEDFLSVWAATKPDIALLDINIDGKLDGIDIARIINQSNNPIPIIFITSIKDQETFERAKDLSPFAYIIKPFDEMTLQRTIELAVYKYINNTWETPAQITWQNDLTDSKLFFIKFKQSLKKINVEDILYIKVEDKYSHLQLQNEEYNIRMTLKELASKLPASDFERVHRNYIINLKYIENISLKNYEILLKKGEKIPMSPTYKDNLIKKLNLLQ